MGLCPPDLWSSPPEYFTQKERRMVLSPRDESELAEVVAGAKGPLAIRGGGTRGFSVDVEGDVLSTAGLSGISLYEPGALTIVASAGTPVAEVEAALAAEGQVLPFEPMDHRVLLGSEGEPTIGGVVAANVSGPRRLQAGACRDSLIGVRFVDGRGDVLKNGGRVMKNVTGYDLVKLMAGSYGTLGVLSEVSFKVLPKPDATAVLLLNGLSVADAVAAMSAALASPFEVSGAAHVPVGLDGAPVTMIRVEGFENSVVYRAGRLKDLLARYGVGEIERRSGGDGEHGVQAGWAWVRDVEAFKDKACVWRVSLKASDAPAMLDGLAVAGMAFDALLDWGGGLVWVASDEARAEALHKALQGYAAGVGGHATLVKEPEGLRASVPVFQPEIAPLAKLADGLRARFDPRGILNPGVMG